MCFLFILLCSFSHLSCCLFGLSIFILSFPHLFFFLTLFCLLAKISFLSESIFFYSPSFWRIVSLDIEGVALVCPIFSDDVNHYLYCHFLHVAIFLWPLLLQPLTAWVWYMCRNGSLCLSYLGLLRFLDL